MNVRFSSSAVRCRVSREEFDSLLVGRSVSLEVALPRNHAFRLSVRPGVMGGWQFDSDPTGMWLTIPRAQLESLAQSLPSREGIEQAFDLNGGGQVQVSFEVDVRKPPG